MGLPTTANYVVVSTLMAPVVVELGAQSGLLVPLIAVHLFVFYFGLMADVTPPVGLAVVRRGRDRAAPIRSRPASRRSSTACARPSCRSCSSSTPQLLMIGIDSSFHLALTVLSAVIAMLVFAAATQGYFLVRSRWYESLLLLLITFTLFRPGFWWDMVYPPYEERPPAELMALVEKAPKDERKRIWVEGTNLDGKDIRKGVLLPLGEPGKANERLKRIGLTTMSLGGDVQVAAVAFGSTAEKLGLEQGFKVTSIEVPADRPSKEWMFVPALLLLAAVVWLQRRRLDSKPALKPAAA